MSQITRTTNDVIVNSLYLISELGVGETPDAFMLTSGLELINELLDKFCSDGIFVPFLTTINAVMTPGQATYDFFDQAGVPFNTNRIVELVYATFNTPTGSNTATYPIQIVDIGDFYNTVRLSNLQSLPIYVYLNKQGMKSEITFYPTPDKAYEFQLVVKAMINSLTNQSTLDELPPLYYGFLKYALARKFLTIYPSGSWTPQAEEEYQDYYRILKSGNPVDVAIRPNYNADNIAEGDYWKLG